MYLSFYALQKKPFEVSTDPCFLWLGEKHKEALATLKYGNLGNQGFTLLTGDVGTGKTTLINALINNLGDEVIVAKVPDPGMEVMDFMNYISHAFGMKKQFVSKDAFLIHFDHFLNSAHAAGKKSLLIIDEAQRLSPALLEEVRQLSNIEKQETKLLSIFFVGQNEFNDVLLQHKNRALRQRISINYDIKPLDLHETGEFIRHRLDIAGAEQDIFTPDAIRKVYEFSGGFPRRVNIICDHSLLLGFGESSKTITAEIVKECAKDILLPEFSKNKSNESLQAIDTAASENSKEIPSERIQEGNARKGWKVFSVVVLVAMAVVIVTFIMYPGEYRELFSPGNNNEVQTYSGEHGANSLSPNSFSEPNRETASSEGVGTSPETIVADEGAQEVLIVDEPPVDDVKQVRAVSAEERPNIPEKMPIVPDLLNNGAGIPGDGKRRVIIGDFHSTQVNSPSNLNHKNPSNEEETQKTPVISETDVIEQPLMIIKPVDTELVPPRMVNLQNQTIDQVTESIHPFSEGVLIQGSETEPGQDDPERGEVALKPDINDQSSELADEELNTSNVTDSLASRVSDETKTEIVEPKKYAAEDHLKIDQDVAQTITNDRLPEPAPPSDAVEPYETDQAVNKEPEKMDPGALIDWVIKKRSN